MYLEGRMGRMGRTGRLWTIPQLSPGSQPALFPESHSSYPYLSSGSYTWIPPRSAPVSPAPTCLTLVPSLDPPGSPAGLVFPLPPPAGRARPCSAAPAELRLLHPAQLTGHLEINMTFLGLEKLCPKMLSMAIRHFFIVVSLLPFLFFF